MPASIWPSAIFIAIEIVASRPVPHARCMSMPGVAGSRPDDSTHSRTRLKSLECFSTAPPVTSPSLSPAMRNLATSACNTVPKSTPDSRLNALVEEYFDEQLELSPMSATAIGDPRFDDRLDEST